MRKHVFDECKKNRFWFECFGTETIKRQHFNFKWENGSSDLSLENTIQDNDFNRNSFVLQWFL